MKLSPNFEILIIAILLAPFVYLFQNWQPELFAQNFSSFMVYCVAVIIFYFLPLFFQQLDAKRINADVLVRSGKKIRLIWTSYLSVLGFILFYYSFNNLSEERIRFLGVALSLFLFASGNFQQNLHPTSAFAGNGWLLKNPNEKTYRASQRFTSKLFFWVGIAGTIFFISNWNPLLNMWGLIFIGIVIFYGILMRMIKNEIRTN